MLNKIDEKIFKAKEIEYAKSTNRFENNLAKTNIQFKNREMANYEAAPSEWEVITADAYSDYEQLEIDEIIEMARNSSEIKIEKKENKPIKSGHRLAYKIMKLNGVWYAFRKKGNAIQGYPSFSCKYLNVVTTWCADHDKGHYNAYFRKEGSLEKLYSA